MGSLVNLSDIKLEEGLSDTSSCLIMIRDWHLTLKSL